MALKLLQKKRMNLLPSCDSMGDANASKYPLSFKLVAVFLLASFLIIAYGQPARQPVLGIFSGVFGFALFWRAMLSFSSSRHRFCLAASWFFATQLVQLSWMSTTVYMGPFILVVYLSINAVLALQFAFLSLRMNCSNFSGILPCLGLAGLWVLFEWSRLFICTGFTWNPAGLFLSCNTYSCQLASVFGIYGLSFWVILVNLLALQASLHRRLKIVALWTILAMFPYIGGAIYIHSLEKIEPEKSLKALLVQTALLPERKDYDPTRPKSFMPLVQQWRQVLHLLKQKLTDDGTIDLIILPEGALPYGAYYYTYDLKTIETIWEHQFGKEALLNLPPLEKPLAFLRAGYWKVTNAYWAQAIANQYLADVILGLDDEKHNAAFLFRPHQKKIERYEKTILVPISEYVPFSQMHIWSNFIANQFGITQSFSPGNGIKVMPAKVPLAISICYEETYGQLCREGRVQGAKLFVNLTNDAWFPSSLLAKQHFDHGIIRSVENGVSVIRSCNTGITGGVDRFGRILKLLPPSEKKADALLLEVPLHCHFTLYTLWGDWAILLLSSCFFLIYCLQYKKTLP